MTTLLKDFLVNTYSICYVQIVNRVTVLIRFVVDQLKKFQDGMKVDLPSRTYLYLYRILLAHGDQLVLNVKVFVLDTTLSP